MMYAVCLSVVLAVQWQHPAGIVTEDTLNTMRATLETQPWAQAVYAGKKRALDRWVDVDEARLRAVFPRTRGNVYHNFSTPGTRVRLDFDPFNPGPFADPETGERYAPDTDAGIYEPSHRYHGTMYDGWVCIFYLTAARTAAELAVVGAIEKDPRYAARARLLLELFAETLRGLPLDPGAGPQFGRILTYHREGDNKILYDLAQAYEWVRDTMPAAARARIEGDVLERLLDDIMLEPYYPYDHNNVYQWHRTIIQTALALEREELIDWSFGYGAYGPDALPDHRSVQRIAADHFNADGAFWELCSGYHLYPVYHFCELAVLSHNLSAMDPDRFPAERYDLTSPYNPGGRTIKAALEWFLSVAMPDGTVPVLGDSTVARAGMADYNVTAEVGYRYYKVRGIGVYDALREGRRSWESLLFGAPAIVQHPVPFTSSYLSSGWVALRNVHEGNAVWAGLNAFIPGGGHQHADRLALVTYNHGTLLALEKATPYNEATTRVLGTLTPSHNTVVIDGAPQPQGESLAPDQVPKVAQFFAGPVVQYAEVHGDALYETASVYRRSIALIEDVLIDVFRVEGGGVHDWLVHHAGGRPELSTAMEPASFAPAEWLYNGSNDAHAGTPGGDWSARWPVGGVTSRLTMLGNAGTRVYALETYPVENAVVTADHPPCQTLCVRRDGPVNVFAAVWDAWRETPNLQAVAAADSGEGVRLDTASHAYYIQFGPGRSAFDGGVQLESDGAFLVVRDRDAVTRIGGTACAVVWPDATLRLETDRVATIAADYDGGTVTIETAGPIQYDTYGGRDHYRDAPGGEVTVAGTAWRVKESRIRFAGHVEPAP